MNLKKDLAIIGGLFLLVVAILVFGKSFTSTSFVGNRGQATKSAQATKSGAGQVDNQKQLSVKNLNLLVDVADTKDKRQKGLSSRDQLPFSEGLLFVFDSPSQYAIWMKGMKFAIDIIWIDENKKIVDIAADAVPEPDKRDGELKIYQPRGPAKYVLEINAGLAKLNNLQIGDAVGFEL